MDTAHPAPDASIAQRRADFKALHAGGCFMLPNPWDAGSARYLQSLGFQAIATTSSGHAWSQAQADGDLSVDAVLAHLREMAAATDLPVNADFEDGFGDTPEARRAGPRRMGWLHASSPGAAGRTLRRPRGRRAG